MRHRRRSVFQRRFHPCGFSLCVRRVRLAPRNHGSRRRPTAHAAETTPHADSCGSCAAVISLARCSATRPRTLHDWAGPTFPSVRQRSWDSTPFAVFPTRGSRRLRPGALHRAFVRRSSPLAVFRLRSTPLILRVGHRIQTPPKHIGRALNPSDRLLGLATAGRPNRMNHPINPAMSLI